MTEEQLKKGNTLTGQIVALKAHKKQILEYTNNLERIDIRIEHYNSQIIAVMLKPSLFIIDAARQMQFYLDELDKQVTALESELAAL